MESLGPRWELWGGSRAGATVRSAHALSLAESHGQSGSIPLLMGIFGVLHPNCPLPALHSPTVPTPGHLHPGATCHQLSAAWVGRTLLPGRVLPSAAALMRGSLCAQTEPALPAGRGCMKQG